MTAVAPWSEVSLGEICEFKYGKSLPGSRRASGHVPVYGSNGDVGTHDVALTQGPTIIVGRKGSFGEVHYSDVACWPIDTTYYVDQTSTEADLRWLAYRLSSMGLTKLNRAATVPGLNREDAYRERLLVPPLPEQRRIAAILDQADALRAKRRAAIAQLDTLAQSIFLEMFGDPVTNPAGWASHRLAEVADLENGDRSGNYPSGDDIKGHGVLFLSTKNIREGTLDLTTAVYISDDKFASLSRGKARRNDLVITLRGTLGNCCVFASSHDRAFINAQLLIIRPKHGVLPAFLHAVLTSDASRARFQRMGSGVAVPQLTSGQMAELEVPVPSLSFQEEFHRRVAAVHNIKVKHNSSLHQLDALLSSLQYRAFRGEL